MIQPLCLSLRVVTENVKSILIFRKFTVQYSLGFSPLPSPPAERGMDEKD